MHSVLRNWLTVDKNDPSSPECHEGYSVLNCRSGSRNSESNLLKPLELSLAIVMETNVQESRIYYWLTPTASSMPNPTILHPAATPLWTFFSVICFRSHKQ